MPVTPETTLCAFFAFVANCLATPFLSPLALIFMADSFDRGAAMLVNSAFSAVYGILSTSLALTHLLAPGKIHESLYYLSGSPAERILALNFESTVVLLTTGLVSIFVYALPQMIVGIKSVTKKTLQVQQV